MRLQAVTRDPAMVRLLAALKKSRGWQLETVASNWEAMEQIQAGVASHLLLLDVSPNDGETLHFMRWLTHLRPDLPVILICYPDDAKSLKKSVGLRSAEVLVRPFDAEQIESAIRNRLTVLEKIGHANMTSKSIEPLGPEAFFVSASPIMQKLRAQAAFLAKSDVPVLIVGESGAGKCTVASLIHQLSVRSGFKLQRVNCSEMPESVLEAELFGDNTTAVSRPASLGKFGTGEKGTIFLEEIADMPMALQARLLQVLENNDLQNDLQNSDLRTGAGDEGTSANVRILASSSSNLERALMGKQLREDLYYRLSAFTVQVPPLRQRKDEIATLLRYFMHKLAKHYSLPARAFPSSMITACQQYSWPENLKELEAFVKRYLVAGDQGMSLRESGAKPVAGLDQITVARAVKLSSTAWEQTVSAQSQTKPESLKSLIQGVKSEAERNAIGAALMRTGWNRKAAARLLRVSYRTLLYKIEQYHMRAPQPYFSPLPVGEFLLYDEVKNNGKAS
ncbi:MAG: sigma 54-interacting transcriptional regulator [Candidatus Sulfotelmatobacter sp.]